MSTFTVHTIESAPEKAKPLLAASKKAYGFIPNLHGVFAEAPALLEGYQALSEVYGRSSLSAAEQQVVLLAVSYENACHYCVAAHTGAGKMAGLSDENIEALRNGAPLPDAKLEALRQFTQRMVQSRGWPGDAAIEAFLQAGYTKQQLLDVILGIAVKTMSNYTNHLAHTPLDEVFKANAWQKPADERTGT